VFLLPLVLCLIGVAQLCYGAEPFASSESIRNWRMVHSVALLGGTMSVTLGFATGMMYLLQSYRLKHNLPPSAGMRLPTLEWLQRFNREAMFVSTLLLAVGLLSGIVMNLSQWGRTLQWRDPAILSSALLFLWLLAATLFESLYRPARQGRKVAYLTLASFLFLVLALALVLFGGHVTRPRQAAGDRLSVAPLFHDPEEG